MSVANPSAGNSPHRITPADIAIVIFARAPRPGHCKTRLAAGMGARRAAALYHALLTHAAVSAAHTAAGRVYLACAPDIHDARLAALAARHGIRRMRQPAGDLGQRMHAATREALRRHRGVVLMGSDQPALADAWFDSAVTALSHPDGAWLAPTRDGGYWALGLTQAEARLFRGPAWSTSRVAAQTDRRLRRCGFRPTLHVPRRDIDHSRDWRRLDPALKRRVSRRAGRPGSRAGGGQPASLALPAARTCRTLLK